MREHAWIRTGLVEGVYEMAASTDIAIMFSDDVKSDDLKRLTIMLDEDFQTFQTHERNFGAEWIVIIAALKDAAAIAGGLSSLVKLAEAVIEWRRKMQEENASTNVRIKKAGASEVDLNS